MKATRIVIPASAAVAAIILTACADKPVRIPGGSFVEEPYTGETTSRNQTIPSNGEKTIETEVIYIEDDVPVGPVEDNQTGLQGGDPSVQGGDATAQQGGTLQPVEQQPTVKSNVPEGSVEYKVVKGDTLWSIGMVYGVSVARLAEINGISEKSTLRVGQVLMIPPDAKNAVGKPVQKKTETKPATTTKTETKTTTSTKPATATAAKTQPVAKDGETLYVVKSGDNLSMIAYRHHVKLADLIAANKVDPNAILRVGQMLVIPAATSKTASTTTKTTTTTTTKTDSGTKTATATTTKTATATTTKTEPATTTKPAATSTTTQKAGEGTGGIVEPIGGGSMGGSASTSTPAASTTTKPAAGSATSGLTPVSGLADADVFAVPIDAEYTIEEVAEIHDKNVEDLIRLNPEFKPGQKIPAGTAVKMPLF